ncbi:MAG: hypothetical protein PVF56_08480 [Desulfobacterales bacterium]|jgi:hypothetical protein
MKKKFLFYSAILFLFLARHYHDELIFYFFSLHLFMLYIAVFFHKRELKAIAKQNIETPPVTESTES